MISSITSKSTITGHLVNIKRRYSVYCLSIGFCSHSSIYMYAIIVLLVLFFICVKLVSNIYIIPELCVWLEYTWTVGNDEPVVKERWKWKKCEICHKINMIMVNTAATVGNDEAVVKERRK